jgi:hypothetical protein
MKKQPYPIAQLTGGLDVSVDPVFLMDKASPFIHNVWLHKGLVKKGLGRAVFGTVSGSGLPLSGTVMYIDSFPLSNSDMHYLFMTESYVYSYNSTTGLYAKMNKVSGTPVPFTGTVDNCFSSAIGISSGGAEWYLLSNGIDDIQYWDGNLSNKFANLAGWETATGNVQASQLIYFKNRLVAGGTTEAGNACPKRIRWSAAGDITDITGTGSGFFDLVDTDDWITSLVHMKDKLYVFKERSIWELEYVGGTTVFNPIIKIEGVGTYSPNSIVPLDEEILFYGSDNIYTFDGFGLKPIGAQIYSYLYETKERVINNTVSARFCASYLEELKLYVLCVARAQKQIPDLTFSYDFDYKAWTMRVKEITAIGFFDVETGDPWNALVGDWNNGPGNEQDWVWMSRDLAAGAPTTLYGDSSGYVWEDDRTTKDTDYMCYQTKDFLFDHAVRWVEFRMQIVGGPFIVSYSTDTGVSWSDAKSFGASTNWTEYTMFLNFTSQKVRFKIECAAQDLQIKWLEPWFIPRARSKVLRTA